MRTKKFILIPVLAIMTLGVSAQQVTDDFGTWSTVEAIKSWGDPMMIIHLEHRSMSNATDTEAFFGVLGAAYKFTPWLSGEIGYEFWRIPNADRTLHKGIIGMTGTLKSENITFQLREKYELAFNQAGGAPTHTLRSRIRGQYSPGNTCLKPYIMYEIFNGFGDTYGWIRSLHYLGTDIVVNRHNVFDVYYMYHMFPDAASGLTCSRHILGVTYRLLF